jgi:Tfp pilus assembly protein PilX
MHLLQQRNRTLCRDSQLRAAETALRAAETALRAAETAALRAAETALRAAETALRAAETSLRAAETALRAAEKSCSYSLEHGEDEVAVMVFTAEDNCSWLHGYSGANLAGIRHMLQVSIRYPRSC